MANDPLVFALVVPAPLAAVPFTFSAPPDGAPTSRTRLKLLVLVLPIPFVAVTDLDPESEELDHVYVVEYGLEVSSPPPVKPDSAGKLTFCSPDSGSPTFGVLTLMLLDVPLAPL